MSPLLISIAVSKRRVPANAVEPVSIREIALKKQFLLAGIESGQ